MVPVPALNNVQLFVNFGINEPQTFTFTIIDLCSGEPVSVELTSDCFIVANNGSYWYGVFRNFEAAAVFQSYVIALEVVYANTSQATFFSEEYANAIECDRLTKLHVCYPDNYMDEDLNGIYVGEPLSSLTIFGNPDIFYQHQYWIRDTEIIEVQNKITYTANSRKNFATKLSRIWEFRTELVPGWYKDYIAAVYFRGNFFINDTAAKAVDLSFENVLEDADLWKPWVRIEKETKGSFGCAPIICEDLCVCYPPIISDTALGNATIAMPYNKVITISGSGPFSISNIVKPTWMTVVLSGNTITLSGTPNAVAASAVTFDIANTCGTDSFDGSVNITEDLCISVGFNNYDLPTGAVGQAYSYSIGISGTPSFSLNVVNKPSWMNIIISGINVQITGTPSVEGIFSIEFQVSNQCGTATVNANAEIAQYVCEDWYNNSGVTQVISFTSCNGSVFFDYALTPGQSACVRPGTLSGPGSGFLINIGNC
jgi:hypothetical protein